MTDIKGYQVLESIEHKGIAIDCGSCIEFYTRVTTMSYHALERLSETHDIIGCYVDHNGQLVVITSLHGIIEGS